ncbi:FAR1 DNA binding domain [Macleaya cordata]|uniref:Protein FAR1-RELATED SEQUENCE n=1 Tax=Macleaya cordata TaxID=56857 RepID=A0A200PR76_MACCD|nr:FAR1 DNA binding domain [Macleaya cordata]
MEFEPLNNMENDVMEFDIGSGEEEDDAAAAGIVVEHPDDEADDYEDEVFDGSGRRELLGATTDADADLEPYEGMEFESEEAARIFYNSYARRIGFSTRVSTYHRSRHDDAIICRQIVCSRQGFHQGRDRNSKRKQKRPRAVARVGCKAMIMVKKKNSGKWVVSKIFKEHNHELVPPDKVHCLRSHKHISGPARSLIDTLHAAGIGPSGVMSVLIKESGGVNNVGFSTVDYRNYLTSRQRHFGGGAQQVLAKQYEKAVASRHEKEVKADYDTINTAPVLKTPSPMEKQAANLYTRRIFMKFQEELVETLAITATKIEDSGTVTTYRVAKFGEDHKAYIVRHTLAVFRVTNVLTLPSHYVLKRWSRNAKSGVVVDDHALELASNSKESSVDRFNNLRQEVIKYVDEGAKSSHTYNVAMDALKEAIKKVIGAKKHGAGVTQVGTLLSGSNGEVHLDEGNRLGQLQSCSTDEKEKKIAELVSELESANERCEVYRANLLAVLKDMEEQKLKLSVKVQNVRLGLKD